MQLANFIASCTCDFPFVGEDCTISLFPNFPTIHGDPHNSGRVNHPGPRMEYLRRVWTYTADLGDVIQNTGVLGYGRSDGNPPRLYVGTDSGRVLGLNVSDGTLEFKFDCHGSVLGSPAIGQGSKETEHVYVASVGKGLYKLDAERCYISTRSCLIRNVTTKNMNTGDLLVTRGTFAQLYIPQTSYDNKTMYIAAYDLDLNFRWEVELPPTTTKPFEDMFQLTPAVNDRRLYIAYDCGLYVIDVTNGKIIATAECPGGKMANDSDRFASSVTLSNDERRLYVQTISGRLARYDISKRGQGGTEIYFNYVCLASKKYFADTCCRNFVGKCGEALEEVPPELPLPSPSIDSSDKFVFYTQYRLDSRAGPMTGLFLMDQETGVTIWEVDTNGVGDKFYSRSSPTIEISGIAYILAHNLDHSVVLGVDPYPDLTQKRTNVLFEVPLGFLSSQSIIGHQQIIIRVDENGARRLIIATDHRVDEFIESFSCLTTDKLYPCSNHGVCNFETVRCKCNPGWAGEACDVRTETACPSYRGKVCSGNGKCISSGCSCNSGYIGIACDVRANSGFGVVMIVLAGLGMAALGLIVYFTTTGRFTSCIGCDLRSVIVSKSGYSSANAESYSSKSHTSYGSL